MAKQNANNEPVEKEMPKETSGEAHAQAEAQTKAEAQPHEQQTAEEPMGGQPTTGPSGQAGGRVVVDEMTIRGNQLLDTVQKLLKESTVQRIKVKNKEGRVLLDVPVWVAAVGSATAIIAVPLLTALGLLGGLFANLKLEVERVEPPEHPPINKMEA